jgi:hypothetical protein
MDFSCNAHMTLACAAAPRVLLQARTRVGSRQAIRGSARAWLRQLAIAARSDASPIARSAGR